MRHWSRRVFLSVLGPLGFASAAVAHPRLGHHFRRQNFSTSEPDPRLPQSFDCRIWAAEFVRMYGGDEELMMTWFANAIMAGYDEAQRRHAPQSTDEWRPSEALFAFAGWLTSRDEPVTMSARHNAAPAADLVAEFCKRHQLSEPREGWYRVIVHPEHAR